MARLDQILARLGYGSRREAQEMIRAGRVTIAGAAARDPSLHASVGDVRVDGTAPDHPEGLLLALNKPLGLVCSHDPREGANVYSLLPERWRRRNPPVTSIGRLDKETTGLLLLTDQSKLVHQLTSPRHKVPKAYLASVDRDLAPDLPALFRSGTLRLQGEYAPCAPAELRLLGPRRAEIVLTEGRYHQVRRMFAAGCGATVTALHRTRFGSVELGELPPGRWRELPPDFPGLSPS